MPVAHRRPQHLRDRHFVADRDEGPGRMAIDGPDAGFKFGQAPEPVYCVSLGTIAMASL